ncbi:MAG: hypothetical protein KC910_36700, partial [Candidatus Eremiobacteraeota bacterium]|nr:hypothetical protein [Candidatus Eremiobacteraeota bacterium]
WEATDFGQRALRRLSWYPESHDWAQACLATLGGDLQGRSLTPLVERLLQAPLPATDQQMVSTLRTAISAIAVPNDRFKAAHGLLSFLVNRVPTQGARSLLAAMEREPRDQPRLAQQALELFGQLSSLGPAGASGAASIPGDKQGLRAALSDPVAWMHADLALDVLFASDLRSQMEQDRNLEALLGNGLATDAESLKRVAAQGYRQTDNVQLGLQGMRRLAQLPRTSAWAGVWEAALVNVSGSDEAEKALLKAAFGRGSLKEGLASIESDEERYGAALGALLVLHHQAQGQDKAMLADTLTQMRSGPLVDRSALAIAAVDILERRVEENPIAPEIGFGEDSVEIGGISLPRN